jgi:hypothetical protein
MCVVPCRLEQFDELDTSQFSDVLCKNLRKSKIGIKQDLFNNATIKMRKDWREKQMKRVTYRTIFHTHTHTHTHIHKGRGRNMRKSLQQTCSISRRYLDEHGIALPTAAFQYSKETPMLI